MDPARTEPPVTSIRDFLEDILEEAVELRSQMDEGIRRLRERIHALRLAEDAQFVREHLEFSKNYDPDAEPGLTREEFAELYLTPG